MSEEFIREVDEEIKEERQMQLWKKLAPYFIALASAIILITISIVGWQTYSKKQKESLGDDFSAAVELIQEQDTDAALLALEKVASSSSDGYITLAKMKQASILISDGKIDDGLKLYQDLENTAVDSSFRDISTLFYVLNAMDHKSVDFLMKKLDKFSDNNPWSATANELRAFLFLKDGNINDAKKMFEKISKRQDVPRDIKGRSNDMLNFLKNKN